MVAPRRVIALPTDADQRQRLVEISRSRTEPTSRVERARIILAYLEDPSAYAVARTIGVTQQTVTRCLERAAELGVIEALDDRPRAGRDPVSLPRRKPGWWHWRAGKPRNWVIPTNCGPPGCSLRMPGNTDGPPGIRAWRSWPRGQCARSWPSKKSSRTRACPREGGGALLPGTARSRVRAQDGRDPLCLPTSGDAAGGRGEEPGSRRRRWWEPRHRLLRRET